MKKNPWPDFSIKRKGHNATLFIHEKDEHAIVVRDFTTPNSPDKITYRGIAFEKLKSAIKYVRNRLDKAA